MDLSRIDTERSNPATAGIDRETSLGIVRMIHAQDKLVAEAVGKTLPQIAEAADLIHGQLALGGRLVYLGSGTSGRLGALDAAECPPTFGVPEGLVVGLIAGGPDALLRAKEGAEDDGAAGEADLRAIGFNGRDALVGIAASGRTPYVMGGMAYAASLGAPVIALVSTADAPMSRLARVTIAPLTGPEAIAGSTRMKAGTAQKMVLNMLSTAVMVKLGKVYGNLMVDVRASNEKLRRRAVRIVQAAAGVADHEAEAALDACGGSCKAAIVALRCGVGPQEAASRLTRADGRVREALRGCGPEEL